MFRCEMQRQHQMQAHAIEAVAFGYAGVKSSKGSNVMRKVIEWLRR